MKFDTVLLRLFFVQIFPFNRARIFFYPSFFISFFTSPLLGVHSLIGCIQYIEYKALISPFPCHALTLFISLQQILFLLFVAAYCHYYAALPFETIISLFSLMAQFALCCVFSLSIHKQRGSAVVMGIRGRNKKQKKDSEIRSE